MNLIKNIIDILNISMETPKSYGAFHILFVIIGLIVVATLAYFLRNTNEKQNKIVLLTCSSFLIICEIIKQLDYYLILENPGYDWWVFPFQLCSVPMYLCFIVAFVKQGVVKNAMYNFLAIFNMFSGAISFVEPSGLLHDNLFLTLHSCTWHMMLIFIGVYLMVTKRAGTSLKDFPQALIVFGIVVLIAQSLNFILKDKGVNLFYISPFKRNPIAVFKDIWDILGPWFTMILYISCIALGAFIFFIIKIYLVKLINLIIRNRKTKIDNS